MKRMGLHDCVVFHFSPLSLSNIPHPFLSCFVQKGIKYYRTYQRDLFTSWLPLGFS